MAKRSSTAQSCLMFLEKFKPSGMASWKRSFVRFPLNEIAAIIFGRLSIQHLELMRFSVGQTHQHPPTENVAAEYT